MDDLVTVTRRNGTATVTMNRPDKLNALCRPMWPRLTDIFTELAADEDMRCVVLRGSGEAFCTGADIAEFQQMRPDPEGARAYGLIMDQTYAAIEGCPHPTVAAIGGSCTGGGMLLALLCDIRLSAARSRFGVPISRLGLSMPYSEFRVLSDAIGHRQALRLVLEARLVGADEAKSIGLVDRVVPDQDLDSALSDTVGRITAGAPLANRHHKILARRMASGAPFTDEEVAWTYALFSSDDYHEGYRAFLEKRAPRFSGR